jgi:hypothetical protein
MTAAVTGVLRALVQATNPKAPPLIPDQSDLDARLTTNPATRRQALEGMMMTLVPVRNKLVGQYNFSPAKIASLQRHPSAVVWPEPPNPTNLDDKPYTRMDHKLGRVFGIDLAAGERAVSDYDADEASWAPAATLEEAREQWTRLNALVPFYLRVRIAIDASKIAGVSLAEALALYRVEGDLVVPMPQAYLDNRMPPFESGFETELDAAYWVLIKPTMQHALWSFDQEEFRKRVPILDAADREEFIKFLALRDWLVAIGGLDFVSHKIAAAGAWPGGRDAYTKFCHDVRVANGLNPPMADSEAAYRAQRDNLKFDEVSGRLVVAPKDAVLLASEILGHALLVLKAVGKGPAGSLRAVPALNYLVYNTSDILEPKPALNDKFNWILASAAFALAKKTAAPGYCPAAHAKMQSLKLPEAVKGVAGRTTLPDIDKKATVPSAEHVAVLQKIDSTTFTTTEKDQFAQFILRATAEDWSGFKKNRANASRHARALAYYKVVAA